VDGRGSALLGIRRSPRGAAVMPSQSHLVRQLKLFAWSLLVINLFIVAVAPIAGDGGYGALAGLEAAVSWRSSIGHNISSA